VGLPWEKQIRSVKDDLAGGLLMAFAKQARIDALQARASAGIIRRRNRIALTLVAAAVGSAMVCPAQAQAPSKDLWQTYMEAALFSDQTDDFNVEAIILDAALAHARKHDPDGQRPALSRLPLMLAYAELDRKDLLKPLSDQGMHIDVSNLDKRYNDYIQTVDDYASSYYDRWSAHGNDKPYDEFRQGVRLYGTKNSYLIEVALRAKLKPSDQIGLAKTLNQSGLVYRRVAFDYDCAAYEYGRAFQTFQDFELTQDAMTRTSRLFSVGEPTTATTEQAAIGQNVNDTQAYLVMQLGMDMRDVADQTLHAKSDSPPPAKTDLAQCDGFGPTARTPPPVGFDAHVSRASEYYVALLRLTKELHDAWPTHPFFGWVEFRLAGLYAIEFEMSKVHPEQYSAALAKARNAYQRALSIITNADGANSQYVHTIATEYVDVLVEANLPEEAKKIESTYGVTPSN
jgi:hypothetical protein